MRYSLAVALVAVQLSPAAADDPRPADRAPPPFDGIVAAHNALRSELGLPPLRWSGTAAAAAGDWAAELRDAGCELRHPRDGRYGQNLAWFKGYDPSPGEVAGHWAEERADYDYETDSCRPGRQCGHYTQMVWRDTEAVGCATARCGGDEVVWVCNYTPPGNIVGERPY